MTVQAAVTDFGETDFSRKIKPVAVDCCLIEPPRLLPTPTRCSIRMQRSRLRIISCSSGLVVFRLEIFLWSFPDEVPW